MHQSALLYLSMLFSGDFDGVPVAVGSKVPMLRLKFKFRRISLLPQVVRGEKAVLMESYLEDRDLFHDCRSAPDKPL